jgi:hypothetical protein
MTQNLIEKMIFEIDSEISNDSKYILLEIIQKEFIESDKNDNKKYILLLKNFTKTKTESFYLHMFYHYKNDNTINKKRNSILTNLNLWMNNIYDLGDGNLTENKNLNINMNQTQKKLVGSRFIDVSNMNNRSNTPNLSNKDKTQDLKSDLKKILLDVWYAVEFFKNNKFIIKSF